MYNYYISKDLYTKNGTDVYKIVHMFQKWDKILELIFDYPNQSFSVREIAKKTSIPSSSVQRYIRQIRNEKIINEDNKFTSNNYSRFLKAFFIINKMYKTGLVEHLKEQLNPSAIIVFGSVRKGEYDYESDIDIFIETAVKKELKLKNFEDKLKHKIQLFSERDINKLQPNLLNNVINGIKLYGSFKIKC